MIIYIYNEYRNCDICMTKFVLNKFGLRYFY